MLATTAVSSNVKLMRLAALFIILLSCLSVRASKVVTDSVRSDILKTNIKCNVYLPDGFGDTEEKYPVVYLLHGFGQDYKDWCDGGQMQTLVDELMDSGEACRMVIVMPNAGSRDTDNSWNGYMNMPGWNYEDFFFRELVPQIEGKYRVAGDKAHRAVMGLSMGGGGCTIYCQRHPEMFSACYAMSGWIDFSGKSSYPKDSKPYFTQESMREYSAISFVRNADEETLGRLRTVKWFFDCGDDDFLLDLNVQIYQLMRDKKVKAELRVRNGIHNWEYWHQALRIALPFASRSFGNS